MQDQAGTVIGGTTLRSGPHMDRSRSAVRVGMSSAKRSKSSSGVPQSSPMSATRPRLVMAAPLAGRTTSRRPVYASVSADRHQFVTRLGSRHFVGSTEKAMPRCAATARCPVRRRAVRDKTGSGGSPRLDSLRPRGYAVSADGRSRAADRTGLPPAPQSAPQRGDHAATTVRCYLQRVQRASAGAGRAPVAPTLVVIPAWQQFAAELPAESSVTAGSVRLFANGCRSNPTLPHVDAHRR